MVICGVHVDGYGYGVCFRVNVLYVCVVERRHVSQGVTYKQKRLTVAPNT